MCGTLHVAVSVYLIILRIKESRWVAAWVFLSKVAKARMGKDQVATRTGLVGQVQ